ncbi:MAG: LysM domain-containing protein [Planctomycetota bacterium]
MSKLVFLLALIALLVGCQTRQIESGANQYEYDPAVTGGAVTPAEPIVVGGPTDVNADVLFVETDDPALLEAPVAYEPVTYQPEPRTYVVRKGDTYYGIAARELGSGRRWQEVAALNPQYPSDRLPIGVKIKLP